MTAEFQYMMHLAGCAALGSTPEPPPAGIDWEQVLTFANEQTVLPLVQYAMKQAPFEIPGDHRSKAAAALSGLAVQGVVRRMGVLRVLGELERQGISAAVMKGFAIARDYAQPDVRISCDADIYIQEKDEARALAVFEQFGFAYRKREKTEKDTALTHPRFGLVELHVRMFDDFVRDFWHGDKGFELAEPYRREESVDGAYYTLGDTDHFLFVLEHMMKHFVEDGLSLRMLLDVGVLLTARRERIDQQRAAEFLAWRGYGKVIPVLLEILSDYCGFSFGRLFGEQEAVNRADVEAVLEDMEAGGVRGFKKADSNSQKDGLRVYNAKQVKKRKGFMLGWKTNHQEMIRLVFPTLDVMRKKYPCLRKTPILYPVTVIHRLVVRGSYHMGKRDLELKNWQFSVEESKLKSSIGTQRAELFRQLDMM